ncbi:MAG: histidine phosphatase family protein [Nocardioides sp.]|nr:histidine phosphatase family protein [Nocardioides sp.]
MSHIPYQPSITQHPDVLSDRRPTERHVRPDGPPGSPLHPGGEDWVTFGARVRRTLETLADTYAGKTVGPVSHAGFIVKTFLDLFGVPRPGPTRGPTPSSRPSPSGSTVRRPAGVRSASVARQRPTLHSQTASPCTLPSAHRRQQNAPNRLLPEPAVAPTRLDSLRRFTYGDGSG